MSARAVILMPILLAAFFLFISCSLLNNQYRKLVPLRVPTCSPEKVYTVSGHRFIVFGDAETGDGVQLSVSVVMRLLHKARPFSFALNAGDMYPSGVDEFDDFKEKTFDMYNSMDLRVFKSWGNHDTYSDPAKQISVSRNTNFELPCSDYGVQGDGFAIYIFDTNNLTDAQLERGRRFLRARGPWRFILSHHARFSDGLNHGDQEDMEPLRKLVESVGVNVWFAGHDHHMSVIDKGTWLQVISGAGGAETRPVADQYTGRLFKSTQNGFFIAEISGATLKLEAVAGLGPAVYSLEYTRQSTR